MSDGFVHSVKVPRFYKVIAKTVQTVEEEGASIKQVIYEKKLHPNLRGTYGLALTTIQHGPQLDHLLRKTQLLFKESRLDPWLARVLITELLWGKNTLPSEAKPIKTILSYEKVLREAAKDLDKTSVETATKNKSVRKPRYVRINTLLKSVEASIRSFEEEGWTLLPKANSYAAFLKSLASLGEGMYIQDYHIPELFAFPCGTHFYDHPGYKCGEIVLQDKASCIPAQFLRAPPGSTVLDMCSAPGMKTTHLAAIMKNQGKIIAVERDSRRYEILRSMVKTNAADCVTTINNDSLKLSADQCANIEYILVDPSCSGSGMDRIGRDISDAKCAPARLKSLQSFQVFLLRHALCNFPKVKRVVYSTCSMYPEENEMVIDENLENIGDAYNLVPIKTLIGPDWKNFSSTEYKCQDKCLYARPDVDLCNGFFVAVFERNPDVPLPEYKRKYTRERPKNDVQSGDGEHQMGKKKNRKRPKSKGASNNGAKIAKMEGESISDEVQQSNVNGKAINGKKRELKAAEIDNGSMGDKILNEDEAPKKQKKKKRNATEAEIMNVQVDVASATNGDNPLLEKAKKKKRKHENDEELLEQEPVVVEEQDTKKEKKKKKSKQNDEIIEVRNETSESVLAEEQEVKKEKKKKKSKPNEDAIEIQNGTSESVLVEEQEMKKEKKKKKSKPNEDIIEIHNGTSESLLVEEQEKKEKKKKKKSKHNEEIIDVVNGTSESLLVDEEDVKTKKKKKKQEKNNEMDLEIEIVSSSIPEEKSKKKKMKDKNAT